MAARHGATQIGPPADGTSKEIALQPLPTVRNTSRHHRAGNTPPRLYAANSTRRPSRSRSSPQFSNAPHAASQPISRAARAQLNDLYLIVHAVDGLAPGAYFFHRDRNTLELLKQGNFRAEADYLGLQQELPADARVDFFFLAELNPILERFGNRGYRAVQLEAGAIGGKMYLAAYAQQLGATGLTFFDDDVTDFFSPHAAGKSAIFLMAIGHSVKTKT